MAEPQDFPTNGDGTVTDLTWAEGGSAIEPSSGRKTTGIIPGDVSAADEMNWLIQSVYQFSRASWARGVRGSDAFLTSWFVPTGAGFWSTDAMAPLEAFLSDDPLGVNTVAADMWLDPDDTGAVRIQAVVAKASPHLFPANRDTYVFVPIDTLTPPVATEADLQYIDVPVGDPQPATPPGTVAVWRVETDGVGVVDQEILLLQAPILKIVGFEELFVFGDANISAGPGDFTTNIGTDLNDQLNVYSTTSFISPVVLASTATLTAASGSTTTINGTFVVGGPGSSSTFNSLATFNNDVIMNEDVTLGSAAGDALTINATSTVTAQFNMSAALVILGASGGSLSTDPSATCQFNGILESSGRTRILGSASVAAGDISNLSDNLRWRDAAGTKYVHTSSSGLALAHGHSTSIAAAATITLNTSTSVAPIVATTLTVESEFWLQRAVAGDVTVSLIEVGVGQIGTNRTVRVNATAGTTWDRFTFSRPHAASTTPRVYQLSIDGGGSNVTGAEARIMVRPTTSA